MEGGVMLLDAPCSKHSRDRPTRDKEQTPSQLSILEDFHAWLVSSLWQRLAIKSEKELAISMVAFLSMMGW